MRSILTILLSLCVVTSVTVAAVPAEGHHLMISGPSPYAVEVGRKVAARGGNVVDVAVAVGLTLAVTSPYFAALGGGGFALIKMGSGVEALDFREMAPAATNKGYFLNKDKEASITGGSAVGVPGVAAGLVALHQKYGKLKWSTLFEEPLRLATQGFPVSGEWARITSSKQKKFNEAGLTLLLKSDKVPYKPGELLKQPGLARALIALRNRGRDGFYQGAVAKDIASAVQASGGTMTPGDLAAYKVRWLSPLVTSFEGYRVYLMPPPSSGGVVIFEALKLIELFNLKAKPALSVPEYHGLAEVEARAFRGRWMLGDPDFFKNPVELLTSNAYIESLAKSYDEKKTVVVPPLTDKESKESTETTHFSVMDTDGHAIALTVTLNGFYGSAVVSPKFGIALNNEMDDFTTHPNQPNMFGLTQGPGNSVEPGKRPLSSMSPTLVEKDGKVVMALGAPGGPRIITAVLQGLYRILARKTDIDVAVQSPRVHHQYSPQILYVDKGRFSPEVLDGLKARGHVIEEAGGMGKVYVVRLREDGILESAFDARGEGAAGGI